ncbi:calcium-activated potassium channel subunit beta-1 [Platysternon megacephalum]|uniref:Calcium-activated potassium channel subunit beta-1 n=1 Tax=Platysternon megacephalum TaxID=55544 RepID=A0A4D9DWV3_9SAUR|nr:calcium-activated potassium channel subunit beta-1 [Platysternon megacephalum]
MAVSNQFPAAALLLLLPLTQVLAQSTTECSVGNEKPTINENNLRGTVVTTITMEPGVTVTIENSSDSIWFAINGTELILTDSLDYETENALLVTLLCWKGGVEINSVIVVVQVGNLNDNSPVFKETNITVKIPEDTKVNTIVIPEERATASDADLDNVQYELTAITPEATDYFNIQGINNPSIYLRKTLDYDKYKLMQLILYARDRAPGNPDGNTATATINIDIQQADTKPPWFQPCTFINTDKKVCISSGYIGRVNISEKTTEPLILKPGPLSAIDPDYTLNEKIVYSIVGGNKDDVFLLNSDTGNITMNKAANTTETFILHVMATQANNALRYSFTTVEIKVIAKSSHAPYFENSRYTGTVSAGLATLSLVMDSKAPSIPLKIFAADDDFPNKLNPQIMYNIQNSSDFTVTRDGLVLTNTMLQSAATITVLATATDEESLQEANTVITVEVTPSTGTTTLPTPTTTSAAAGTGTTTPKPSGSSSASPPGVTNTASTANSGPTKSTSSVNMTTNNAGTPGPTGKPVTGTPSGSLIPPLVTTTKPATTESSTSAISSMHPVGPSESRTTKFPITGTNPGGTVQSTALPSSPSGGPSPHLTSTPVASRSPRPSDPVSSHTSFTNSHQTGTKDERANLRYTAQDMAAVGATLAVFLVIALLLLGLIVYKHYRNTIEHMVGKKRGEDPVEDLSNQGYQDDKNPLWSTKDNESLRSDTSENGTPVVQQQSDGFPPPEPTVESSIATASAAIKDGEENKEGKDTDSDKEVKSILTKDRKTADDGYKAVWFKDEIDPDTKDDVVVIEDQVEEEDDSDGDKNEEDEEDEQGSQHGDPVVSFILGRAQLQATDGNLKPDPDADTGDDILL